MIQISFLCFLLFLSVTVGQYDNPHCLNNTRTIVHLFEWKWTDIEQECPFLAQAGYCGVQTPIPTEHVVTGQWVWWDRFEPVSYKIDTRSGNETQFAHMVDTCNRLGVRVYVNVELNHMARGSGIGNAGSAFDSDNFSYPEVPYTQDDFHKDSDCTAPHEVLTVSSSSDDMRKCAVLGLPDLDQSKPHVQTVMVNFLNKLIGMGVAGFRLDLAQHMYPSDLEQIFNKVIDVQWGGRPFLINEVVNSVLNTVWPDEYFHLGYVTECFYSEKIGDAMKARRNFTSMCEIFKSSLPSEHALVFVDNFNFQRDRHRPGATVITFQDRDIYSQAQAFTLATGYGIPRILSSYQFSYADEGPPQDIQGHVLDVVINPDGSCGNGWICEHRWPKVLEMVQFANKMRGKPMENCTSGKDFVAFTRGDEGFFWTRQGNAGTYQASTGLPEAVYCDYIDNCQTNFVVNSSGHLNLTGSGNDIMALTKVAELTLEPEIPQLETTTTPITQSTTTTTTQPTTTRTTTRIATPQPETTTSKPAPQPQPTNPKPKPQSQPTRPQPKPQPQPARPQPKPQTQPARPQPKPQPQPARPQPKPQPQPPKPAPQPQPIIPKPKPRPQPTRPKPQPVPYVPTTTPSPWERTVILLKKVTKPGENVFFRGAPYGCHQKYSCSIAIRHRTLNIIPPTLARNSWVEGDTKLDWVGAESGQGTWKGRQAGGSPGQWTTQDPHRDFYSSLNRRGSHYWLLDVDMDCSKARYGLFEFKGYITGRSGETWESDIQHGRGYCAADPSGVNTINHVAKCGKINIFSWNQGSCEIRQF